MFIFYFLIEYSFGFIYLKEKKEKAEEKGGE